MEIKGINKNYQESGIKSTGTESEKTSLATIETIETYPQSPKKVYVYHFFGDKADHLSNVYSGSQSNRIATLKAVNLTANGTNVDC